MDTRFLVRGCLSCSFTAGRVRTVLGTCSCPTPSDRRTNMHARRVLGTQLNLSSGIDRTLAPSRWTPRASTASRHSSVRRPNSS